MKGKIRQGIFGILLHFAQLSEELYFGFPLFLLIRELNIASLSPGMIFSFNFKGNLNTQISILQTPELVLFRYFCPSQ